VLVGLRCCRIAARGGGDGLGCFVARFLEGVIVTSDDEENRSQRASKRRTDEKNDVEIPRAISAEK